MCCVYISYIDTCIEIFFFTRSFRQFAFGEKIIRTCIPNHVLERSKTLLESNKVKMLESCMEASFQLILQLFVVVAGKAPKLSPAGNHVYIY
jgi:hypothetical protein